nr:cell wall-binding repeat-containing protein [Euzebya rosea]
MIRPAGSVLGVLLAIVAVLGAMAVPAVAEKQEVVSVTRIVGDNRFDTAVNTMQYAFATADDVVLVPGSHPATMILGTHLAAASGRPVLLTDSERLPEEVQAELTRLEASTVTVVGSPEQVGHGVVAAVEDLGLAVERLDAGTVHATSAVIAESTVADDVETVVLVGAMPRTPDMDWQAALLGAGLAAALDAPLLLSPPDALDDRVRRVLRRIAPARVLVVGNVAAIDGEVTRQVQQLGIPLERVSAESTVELAVAVAERYPRGRGQQVLVAGAGLYADAIPTAAAAEAVEGTLVLVDRIDPNANAPARSYLAGQDVEQLLLVGGFGGISRRTALELSRAVHGSLLVTKAAPPPLRTSGGDVVFLVLGLVLLVGRTGRRAVGRARGDDQAPERLDAEESEGDRSPLNEDGRPRLPRQEGAAPSGK